MREGAMVAIILQLRLGRFSGDVLHIGTTEYQRIVIRA